MKRFILIFATLSVLASVCLYGRTLTVVDVRSGNPIGGATVFNSTGQIIGLTDTAGCIEAAERAFPLTVSCVGYETSSRDTDTLWLEPRDYALGEITVDAAGRPVTRTLALAREYFTSASGADTVLQFAEYMVEFYTAPEHTKGYKSDDSRPRILNSRRYKRICHDGKDSVSIPDNDMTLSFISLMVVVPPSLSITKRMKEGANTDVQPGKYGPMHRFRREAPFMKFHSDHLANYKNHVVSPWLLKLLGFSVEMKRYDVDVLYMLRADSADYTPADLLEATYSASMTFSGRWVKKMFHRQQSVNTEVFVELWPVDVSHLTIDEYKAARKDESTVPFDSKALADHPLQPAYRSIADRATKAREP